jgi:hypothetical protein
LIREEWPEAPIAQARKTLDFRWAWPGKIRRAPEAGASNFV